MMSRDKQDKQIEEMANVIFYASPVACLWKSDAIKIGEALYKADYRKTSDIAEEIFAEIESKLAIQLRLAEKNRTLFEQEGKNELAEEMSGRIYMLNTMKEYFASLKMKYAEAEDED